MNSKKISNQESIVIEGAKDIFEILKDAAIDCNYLDFVEKILWNKKSENLKEFENIKNLAAEQNIDFIEINNSEFRNLRKTVHSTGIFAVIKKIEFDIKKILNEAAFVVVLDNIQDPGNLGTIIRTASILGASAVITINNSVKLTNPKALRAAKGYFNKFPIIENIDQQDFFEYLNKLKFNIWTADMEGTSIYDDKLKLEKPLCLIFGSEGQGGSDFVDRNTKKICIPMNDTKDSAKSLNVAISVGIMIAEVNRRWK